MLDILSDESDDEKPEGDPTNGFPHTPRTVNYMLKHELKRARKRNQPYAFATLMVSSHFWDSLENPHLVPEDYSLKAEFGGHLHNPWIWRRIMFPCYLNHQHWILVVWNMPRRKDKGQTSHYSTVQIYDSIGTPRDNVWDKIADFFRAGAKNRSWILKGIPQNPKLNVPRSRCPTQRDFYNCGFYVIQIAKALLFGRNPKDFYHVSSKIDDDAQWAIFDSIGKKRGEWAQKHLAQQPIMTII
jgi:hypothetical protein